MKTLYTALLSTVVAAGCVEKSVPDVEKIAQYEVNVSVGRESHTFQDVDGDGTIDCILNETLGSDVVAFVKPGFDSDNCRYRVLFSNRKVPEMTPEIMSAVVELKTASVVYSLAVVNADYELALTDNSTN